MKKKIVTKGFLSQRDDPTEFAILMFFVYLKSLPEDWDHLKRYEPGFVAVRDYFRKYFGWNESTGFDMMIMWGIRVSSAKSKTSKGRYVAMSKAYIIALGMVGQGVIRSNKML